MINEKIASYLNTLNILNITKKNVVIQKRLRNTGLKDRYRVIRRQWSHVNKFEKQFSLFIARELIKLQKKLEKDVERHWFRGSISPKALGQHFFRRVRVLITIWPIYSDGNRGINLLLLLLLRINLVVNDHLAKDFSRQSACLPRLLSARHLAKPSSASISQLPGSGHLANILQKLVAGFSLLFIHLISAHWDLSSCSLIIKTIILQFEDDVARSLKFRNKTDMIVCLKDK